MKELQLSCADFTFPLIPHDKVLRLIAMLGFKGVDVGLFSGRSHLTAESEFPQITKQAKNLKKKAGDCGLIVADIYLQLDNDLAKYAVNHPDKKRRQFARDGFLKLLDYAKEAGADHITCLPGMQFEKVEPLDVSIGRSYDELSWRIEQSNAMELSFSVEVHVGSPFLGLKAVMALVKAVPELRLTLDYTHFIRNGFSQNNVDSLLQYANHFHARGARKAKLQTSMTENVIDYKDIIRKMKSMQYSGWIGLEYIWIAWEQCNQVDTLSETIRLKKVIEAAYAG